VRRVSQIVLPVALTAAVFGIWDLVVNVFTIQSYVLPRPYAVFAQIGTDWDVLQPAMWQTIEEFVVGFFVGVVCGFVLAVVMGESRVIRRGLYPLLIATQAIPIIAIGAALVIWLGFGLTPKVVIVALIIFFPVVVNVLDGLANVDRDTISLARAMGAGPSSCRPRSRRSSPHSSSPPRSASPAQSSASGRRRRTAGSASTSSNRTRA